MKRIILIITLFVSCVFFINAQTQSSNEGIKLYQYCSIKIKSGSNVFTTTMSVDYGYGGFEDVVDEKGDKIKFNGFISCVNYMTLMGWEYYGKDIDEGSGQYSFRREVNPKEAENLIEKMKKYK